MTTYHPTGGAKTPTVRRPLAGAAVGRQVAPSAHPLRTRPPNLTVPILPGALTGSVLDPNWTAAAAGYTGGDGGGGFTPMERPDLAALRDEEIDAGMAAIGAKYKMARKELQVDRDLLGLDFRAGKAASLRNEDRDIEDALNEYAGRGTARSGYAAQELGGIATDAATGRASALASYTAEKNAITQQLKQGLVDSREAEEAQLLVAIRTAYALHQLNEPT